MVERFGGECLSTERLSIVKGQEAYKFKCAHGHIFYKFVTDLAKLKNLTNRKLSKSTAASISSNSDEEMDCEEKYSMAGVWCPKCESFYRSAEILAKNCGFKLVGDLYADNLSLRCLHGKHSTPLCYQKRLQGSMKCSGCRRDEREAVRERRREDERRQDEYYRVMQEKMFAEARCDMEKEMRGQRPAFCG